MTVVQMCEKDCPVLTSDVMHERPDRGRSARRPVSRKRLTRRLILETLTRNYWQLAAVNFHYQLWGSLPMNLNNR